MKKLLILLFCLFLYINSKLKHKKIRKQFIVKPNSYVQLDPLKIYEVPTILPVFNPDVISIDLIPTPVIDCKTLCRSRVIEDCHLGLIAKSNQTGILECVCKKTLKKSSNYVQIDTCFDLDFCYAKAEFMKCKRKIVSNSRHKN